MTNYDRINVPRFKEDKQNGYLCTMCGQYISKDDSVSHKGYNLVCCRCEWKMASILGIEVYDVLKYIHNKGTKTEMEEEEIE